MAIYYVIIITLFYQDVCIVTVDEINERDTITKVIKDNISTIPQPLLYNT